MFTCTEITESVRLVVLKGILKSTILNLKPISPVSLDLARNLCYLDRTLSKGGTMKDTGRRFVDADSERKYQTERAREALDEFEDAKYEFLASILGEDYKSEVTDEEALTLANTRYVPPTRYLVYTKSRQEYNNWCDSQPEHEGCEQIEKPDDLLRYGVANRVLVILEDVNVAATNVIVDKALTLGFTIRVG